MLIFYILFVILCFITLNECYHLILQKLKKAKKRVKEYTLDPAKMTMRDLIRYLPLSNPMT